MKPFKYAGPELDVFCLSMNWKRYWASRFLPYIKGRILEVGAGIGNNTFLLQTLWQGGYSQWTCVEPDKSLLTRLEKKMRGERSDGRMRLVYGTLTDLNQQDVYDTILYLDVLEHIHEDRAEIQRASMFVSSGGHVLVLAPALPFLYTSFDQQIGHYRRYTISSLKHLTPPGCQVVWATYLDSMGMCVSLANRLLMKQSLPTPAQIKFWDRVIVRLSFITDRLVMGRIGKSVMMVWRKTA